MKLVRAALIGIVSLSPVRFGAAAEVDYWIIPSAQLTCIIQNLDHYSKMKEDPVLIFVNDCPETDIAKIISSRIVNTLPKIEKKSADGDGWDEAIVFAKRDLPCLPASAKEYRGDLMIVPKRPCD